jgi:hypothetical protein
VSSPLARRARRERTSILEDDHSADKRDRADREVDLREEQDSGGSGGGGSPPDTRRVSGSAARRVRERLTRRAVHKEVRFGRAELVPDLSRTGSWLLFTDGIPQSQVDIEDPGYLEFEYVRRIGHIADLAFPAGDQLP